MNLEICRYMAPTDCHRRGSFAYATHKNVSVDELKQWSLESLPVLRADNKDSGEGHEYSQHNRAPRTLLLLGLQYGTVVTSSWVRADREVGGGARIIGRMAAQAHWRRTPVIDASRSVSAMPPSSSYGTYIEYDNTWWSAIQQAHSNDLDRSKDDADDDRGIASDDAKRSLRPSRETNSFDSVTEQKIQLPRDIHALVVPWYVIRIVTHNIDDDDDAHVTTSNANADDDDDTDTKNQMFWVPTVSQLQHSTIRELRSSNHTSSYNNPLYQLPSDALIAVFPSDGITRDHHLVLDHADLHSKETWTLELLLKHVLAAPVSISTTEKTPSDKTSSTLPAADNTKSKKLQRRCYAVMAIQVRRRDTNHRTIPKARTITTTTMRRTASAWSCLSCKYSGCSCTFRKLKPISRYAPRRCGGGITFKRCTRFFLFCVFLVIAALFVTMDPCLLPYYTPAMGCAAPVLFPPYCVDL